MSVLLVIHHESHVGDLVFHLELFFFMSQILSWNRKTKVYEKHEGYLSLPKIFRSLLCPYYSLGFLCVFFFFHLWYFYAHDSSILILLHKQILFPGGYELRPLLKFSQEPLIQFILFFTANGMAESKATFQGFNFNYKMYLCLGTHTQSCL